VGVIGLGKMGLLHASIVNSLPDVRVSAIYDKNSTVIRYARKAFPGIYMTSSLDQFSGLNLDAAFITTPIMSHFSVIRTIYSLGITNNIFVEKTLAYTYEQAKHLCQEARSAGGITMVGYMSRFAPTFRKAKALMEEGIIGNALSFKAYAYSSDFAGVKVKSLPDKGGVTRDLGAHIIDQSLWFFGELEVESPGMNPHVKEYSRSGTYFRVQGSGGLVGEYDISWNKEDYRLPEFGMIIQGSKGTMEVNSDLVKLETNGTGKQTWYRHNLTREVPFFLGSPEYYWEDEHFIKAIMDGGTAQPDFNTAAKVDILIGQIEHQVEL
jgi:predicted dehydrogenase